MVFYGLEKNSLVEWPGKVSVVLFVGGCNFCCPFCYNRDLVLSAKKLPSFSEKKILAFLEKRKKFLDGVMITGGEPTILFEAQGVKTTARENKIARPLNPAKGGEGEPQNDLINFIKKIREMGLGVGIETNGSNPEALERLIKEKLIDYVAMDVKAPISSKFSKNFETKLSVRRIRQTGGGGRQPSSKYEELTGVKVDLEKIKKSVNLIKNSGLEYEFRTTVAPLLTEKDILEIVEELKGVKKYVLQVFRPVDTLINPRLAKMKFLAKEDLEKIGQKIKNYFEKFEIRG